MAANGTVYANPHLHRFLRHLILPPIRWFFRVQAVNAEILRSTRPPFLIMGNHSCAWDPFFLHTAVDAPIYFVVSDSQFRSRLLRTVLRLVGAFPKTKAISDLETVKNIVHVKRHKGIIGLFPEGQSTWDGHTLPIVKATAKLVKSLKIPVVIARIQGAYLSWPRWAPNARRGQVQVTYSRALSTRELRSLTVEDVEHRLASELTVDAFAVQQDNPVAYVGRRYAEYLERVLFLCPQCEAVGTLRSARRRLRCEACSYEVTVNPRGFFEPRRGRLRFDTVRAWNVWQREAYARLLAAWVAGGTAEPFLTERAVRLYSGYKTRPLVPLGSGTIALYPDHICANLDSRTIRRFPLRFIEGINVQNNEHLEFYVADELIRVSCIDPRGNTYKWDLAVRLLDQHPPSVVHDVSQY